MLELKSQTRIDERGNTVFDVTIKTSDGREKKRSLSLSDYILLLSESKKATDEYITLPEGFLPENVIESCVASVHQYDIIWRVKGKKRCFLYRSISSDEPKAYTIPFPDLIFRLHVDNDVIRAKECFASKEGDDHLYAYPFGNVSTSGEICMGNIQVTGLSQRVDTFTDDFFLGITNNDYWKISERINIKGCDWSQQKLVDELTKRETFPSEWLMPCPGQVIGFLKQRQKKACGLV